MRFRLHSPGNHCFATFVHKRFEWSLADQSPEQSKTEWLCVDVAGYKIINVYKPQLPSRRSHTPVCMLVTSIANMSSGVTTKHLLTVSLDAWQHPPTLVCCIIQRKQPASSLTDGTSSPTQTWPSRVSARTADCRTDVF